MGDAWPPTSWDLQHILGLVTPRTSGPSFPLLLGLRISRVWMSSRLVVQLQGTSSLCCSPKYLSTISTKIIILLTLLLIFPKYNSFWSTRQKIFVVKTKQPSQTRLGAAESRATAWCLILLRSYIIPFCNTHPGRSVSQTLRIYLGYPDQEIHPPGTFHKEISQEKKAKVRNAHGNVTLKQTLEIMRYWAVDHTVS